MNPPHTGYELVPDKYKAMYKDIDVEALCAQPEFAKAIRELRPKGLGRNKQIVADLIGSGRFGTLTALYRLKNHM